MERISLLPPSLDELIPAEYLVRVGNRVVDELDIEPLLVKYKEDGTSSYHPRMMHKVIVYAYPQKTYLLRKIEKALRKNIGFMRISGGEQTGLSHDQQLLRSGDEVSNAEGVGVTDGMVGGRGACEDGELLCGWDEGQSDWFTVVPFESHPPLSVDHESVVSASCQPFE